MSRITKRDFLLAGAGLVGSSLAFGYWNLKRRKTMPIGFSLSENELASARKILRTNPPIDSHAHPGRTFIKGAKGLKGKMKIYKSFGTFEQKTINEMKQGLVGAANFSTVADFQILGLGKNGLKSIREFEDGEAYASHKRQLANMTALQKRGLISFVSNQSELDKVNKSGGVAAILSSEGGDFLEGQEERVVEAANDGFQYITLLHYHHNELGDIMTAPPKHNGLTEKGRNIVNMMNETHMLIDVAHASEDTVWGVLKQSRAPVLCSHTHIKGPNVPAVSRFISRDLAKEIVASGGVLGAWPAGFGLTNMAHWLDRIEELVEFCGIDHVVLGTDMDANYKPVFENYAKMPYLVGGLKKRGWSDEDLAKFLRLNFIRVWEGA